MTFAAGLAGGGAALATGMGAGFAAIGVCGFAAAGVAGFGAAGVAAFGAAGSAGFAEIGIAGFAGAATAGFTAGLAATGLAGGFAAGLAGAGLGAAARGGPAFALARATAGLAVVLARETVFTAAFGRTTTWRALAGADLPTEARAAAGRAAAFGFAFATGLAALRRTVATCLGLATGFGFAAGFAAFAGRAVRVGGLRSGLAALPLLAGLGAGFAVRLVPGLVLVWAVDFITFPLTRVALARPRPSTARTEAPRMEGPEAPPRARRSPHGRAMRKAASQAASRSRSR